MSNLFQYLITQTSIFHLRFFNLINLLFYGCISRFILMLYSEITLQVNRIVFPGLNSLEFNLSEQLLQSVLHTCSYRSISLLSGSLRDCMAFRTVSQCPLLMSETNPSMLSTVFRDTPVSSCNTEIDFSDYI